jgi:NDP-sugar pyrophosphorylase family protein
MDELSAAKRGITKALLFAAGLGTRLKPFTDNHPKALATVGDKTLLEWNLRYLQRWGITDVVVNVHHFADQIEDTLKSNNGFGSNVTVSDERDEVLETGGGLLKAAPHFEGADTIVAMNVDALTDLDLGALLRNHTDKGALATLAVMKRESSRYLLFDGNMRLSGWRNEKTGQVRESRPLQDAQPFAFTGVQALSPAFISGMRLTGKFSMIDAYLDAAFEGTIIGYDHTGDRFIDVGKPESLAAAGSMFS